MNRGTIYKETSSKGIKNGARVQCNRWCAEIMVDGERKRKRSSDYQILLTWLHKQSQPRVNDARRKVHGRRSESAIKQYRSYLRRRQRTGKLIEVPGCSGYLFDTKHLTMYSMNAACKVKTSSTGSYRVTDDNGEHRTFRPLRLAYALLHGIDYDRIPTSYNIIKADDGCIRVVVAGELAHEGLRINKVSNRMRMLESHMRETSLIYNCYHTGDTTEVVRYTLSRRRQIIRHFLTQVHAAKEQSDEIFSMAMERMVTTLKRPDSMLTNISLTMYHYMRSIRTERKRTFVLKDEWKI